MACNRAKLVGRSCPSLLNPAKLNSNSDCLVCGQCIKSCEPDNIGLYLRAPFHSGDMRESLASWPLTIFVMLVSGFVTSELCTEWQLADQIFLFIPEKLSLVMGLGEYSGWIEGCWTLFVFPFLLWFGLGSIVSWFDDFENLTTLWRRMALPIVVILSAGHMSKGLAKVASWAGYLPHALNEPSGAETGYRMTSGTIPLPDDLLGKPIISVIGLGMILIAFALAIREFHLAQPLVRKHHLIPKLAFAGLLSSIVFGWGAYVFISF